MKEATGELNMTVVTIVAIAALMGFFYLIIWPNLKASMALTSACNSAGTAGNKTGTIYGTESTDDGSTYCKVVSNQVECYYVNGTKTEKKVCD